MVVQEVYHAILELEYRHARLLDADRLEEWPDLFTERGVYQVVPRENWHRAPRLAVLSCDSRAMMVDRIKSLRTANIYNLHYPRHIVTNVEVLGVRDGDHEVTAAYTVWQTDLEGQTRLFSVGQYLDIVTFEDGAPRFREKIAIVDTFNIPNLLAIPI
jgi:anthranilate 1,2-dioxygenase small subunit